MINIAHFISIEGKSGGEYHFQNFFYSENSGVTLPFLSSSPTFLYAPFRVEGASAQLGGDNDLLQILFPFSLFAVRLVEGGNGNRLSSLTVRTVWYDNNSASDQYSDYQVVAQYSENYVGIGASFSETTVELRFRSAMDSVNANFPAKSLTKENAGILPLSADLAIA
jgi:hypothetical protein